MTLEATQVFTPGAFPTHTYVERGKEHLEQSLADSLSVPGQVVSLSGPSKSGKTVLVERVVGHDNLITTTGAGIEEPDDVWNRVLDWMEVPHTETSSSETSGSFGAEVSAKGTAKVPLVGGGEVAGMGGLEVGHSRGKAVTTARGGLQQVVKEIAGSEYVVLIDDFHYMGRAIQDEVAKVLKEAVRLGVKICTASVPHRGDDVVRANPELRGRVRAIDLDYWSPEDLAKIAAAGFEALHTEFPDKDLQRFAGESAGSPQLMQLICLNACFVTDVRKAAPTRLQLEFSEDVHQRILEQTSSSTDFRSLVDVLDEGPRTRGIERKIFKFKDGSEGDVYRCILKALAADPPRLSFNYDELTRRVNAVCQKDVPVGGSVVGTCKHMNNLALQKFPKELAIDWDGQKFILDIPDPHLLFYLRWSGRLSEAEA